MAREHDDINKRRKYAEERFDGKKSIIDDYTGERIFKGNSSESINKHPISKTTDVDHITPIAVLKKRYSGILTDEQIRIIANNAHNYALTNSSLNRAKGGKTNLSYLCDQFEKGTPEDLRTTTRMITKQVESSITVNVQATGMIAKNVGDAVVKKGELFYEGATESVIDNVIPLTTTAIANMIEIAQGKKTINDTGKDFAKCAIKSAVVGGTKKVIGNSAAQSGMVQISQVAIVVKDSAIRYVNGEIDGKEFINEVGEKGSNMVANMLGGEIGAEIGFWLGATVGSTISLGVGTCAGMIIGEAVGRVLGSMIATLACGAIISAKDVLLHMNDYKIKETEISRLTAEALFEIEKQRNAINAIIEKQDSEWNNTVNNAFDLILSTFDGDCSVEEEFKNVTKGLDVLLKMFGTTAKFHSAEEYRNQLDSMLII